MNFPMLNITNRNWGNESDPSVFVLMDAFITNDNPDLFSDYYSEKIFCDSMGDLYRVTGRTLPAEWRKLLRFIPGVYKIQLHLKKLNRRMELEELRKFLLSRINEFELTDFDKKWIKHVEQAPNHYEIIAGQVK